MKLHGKTSGECQIICGDSRLELTRFQHKFDLIVTSPPYADTRSKHYDSIHPDQFCDWIMTFHQSFYDTLKPNGSFILNLKDKIVNGVRHHFVWDTIQEFC